MGHPSRERPDGKGGNAKGKREHKGKLVLGKKQCGDSRDTMQHGDWPWDQPEEGKPSTHQEESIIDQDGWETVKKPRRLGQLKPDIIAVDKESSGEVRSKGAWRRSSQRVVHRKGFREGDV